MTLLAISSSSMLALAIQVCMIVYERLFRPIWSKWIVLAVAAGAFLLSFELIFGMSIGAYIATELSLNQAGAETRLDQITYGLKEVWRHPVFGIGLNIPALPFWRSDIFDNFWLHTAVRYGLPSFLFIAGAFALHFALIALHRSEGESYDMIRRGYQIALAATIVLVGSIPVWGSALVFFMAYLGAGAWFYTIPRDLPPRRAAGGAVRAGREADAGDRRAPAAAWKAGGAHSRGRRVRAWRGADRGPSASGGGGRRAHHSEAA